MVAISADPSETLREHVGKAGWKYTFLSDPQAKVTRTYELLHAAAGPEGTDIPRPAELLIDPSGTIRWVDLTEDYRVRARPETVLRVFDEMTRATS